MVIYILLLLGVTLWILLEKKSLNRKAFWIPLTLLVTFASVRSYLVGTDTGSYTANFRNSLSPEYYYFREETEYGYQVLEYLLLNVTDNYFWLLFTCSLIIVGSYLYVLKKQSTDYFLSVFIFITFGFYLFYFNGLRQGLAMAIVALATPYLINKNFIKFSLIIILASFFHKTALIMFIFYFIIHLKFKLELKAISIFLGSFFISGPMVKYLGSFNEKYSSYAEVSEIKGGYLTLLFYFLISVGSYIFYKIYMVKDKDYYNLMQLHIYGVLFLIPVALLGANPSGPQRLLFYFVWVSTLLIPFILKQFNNKVLYLFFIFISLFYYIKFLGFGNLLPYQLNELFRIF